MKKKNEQDPTNLVCSWEKQQSEKGEWQRLNHLIMIWYMGKEPSVL